MILSRWLANKLKYYYNESMWLYGFLFLGIGIAMMAFNRQVYNFTGRIDSIERKFPAGTLSFIKFFAIVLCLLGILMITGLMSFITDPLFDSLKQTIGGGSLQR